LTRLQQTLLGDGQSIDNLCNEDPADLARKAAVKASAELSGCSAANVIVGFARDIPKKHNHRWSAELTDEGAWIELAWKQPQKIGHVQITFDTGFARPLTITSSDRYNDRMIRAPQPETVRDYTLQYRRSADGQWTTLAEVAGNYQWLARHDFDPVEIQALRVQVTATNGDPEARIFEIRCYA
jgi:hypothetical protein